MTWVHTLLAVWLTLAVPAAGVAAVGPGTGCGSHDVATQDHDGHGHPAGPANDGAPGHADCGCDCAVMNCSAPSSLAGASEAPVHVTPTARWMAVAGTASVPTTPPESPYRPPASF